MSQFVRGPLFYTGNSRGEDLDSFEKIGSQGEHCFSPAAPMVPQAYWLQCPGFVGPDPQQAAAEAALVLMGSSLEQQNSKNENKNNRLILSQFRMQKNKVL